MAKRPQTVINEWLGKPVEVEDPRAKDQCMDWAFKFVDEIGVEGGHATIRAAHARQVLEKFNQKQYDLVATPRLGDLVIWGTDVGPSGHIAVFESGDSRRFVSIDQNWEGIQHVRRVSHTNFGVIGFLRPKVLQSGQGAVSTPQDQTYRVGALDNLYRAFGMHNPAPRENEKRALENDFDKAVEQIRNDAKQEARLHLQDFFYRLYRLSFGPDREISMKKEITPRVNRILGFESTFYDEIVNITTSPEFQKRNPEIFKKGVKD